jgi:hypothetical protein
MLRMSNAEEYSDRAEDCRRRAERCSTELDNKRGLAMAEEWLKMAHDADMRRETRRNSEGETTD